MQMISTKLHHEDLPVDIKGKRYLASQITSVFASFLCLLSNFYIGCACTDIFSPSRSHLGPLHALGMSLVLAILYIL